MNDSARLDGILAFLRSAERLKDEVRSAWTSGGRPETVAAHTWRLALMALVLHDDFPEVDFARLVQLCLIHDLGEAIGGDVPAVQQSGGPEKAQQERRDLLTLLQPLPAPLREEIAALWDEYEAARTPEARLAKALDKLETILQHNQGRNPADFDYRFNLTYGQRYTTGDARIEAIRAVLDRETRARAEHARAVLSPAPEREAAPAAASDVATLTPALAAQFAALALAHVRREYPNKLDHVMNGPAEVRSPRALHPVFYGSFDWHSCVHGYWLLARLCRRFPALPQVQAIRTLFDAQLTEANVAGELAYLDAPLRAGFERPYGWAWLLMLAAELARHETPRGRRWSAALAPLAARFVERFRAFLPRATYPVRVGTHFNTAFALALALEYARAAGDADFERQLVEQARAWYADDEDCQAWEPGGDDFLSSALVEAECMRRALPPHEFAPWLQRFLPRLAGRRPASLFRPAVVSDRSDGKIAHLDGLNLSRAWCWRALAATWPADDPRAALARETAELHLAASLPHVAGDYMGEHWLATFALLALDAEPALG